MSMNDRYGLTIKGILASALGAEPEVVGGEDAGNGLEIFGWNTQDGHLAVDLHHNERPPCGRSAVESPECAEVREAARHTLL